MDRLLLIVIVVRVAVGLLVMPTCAATADDGPDYSAELPRIAPLSPEEGRASIATLPGYRIETTAAEPLVVDPVAMSFDADGRLYVIEMRDYSEQDQAMLGRVRLLEDTDGDGRFDEAEVFTEGLSWPTAITCWDGGVFVGAPPHLYYLKDTTGDGTADEQRIVFTGFGRSNVQGMMNSLRWGIDCRIHGATSSSGGTITRPDDPTFAAVNLAGRDFSFDPRTLDLRPESGGAQHGMCFDDWGTKFVCSNSDHLQAVMYDDRYAARHPYLKAPRARVSIAADGGQAPVFRKSPIEPWRIVRTRLRVAGAVKGPVEGGGKPAGYFTGATGVTIYGGDLMPELRGLAFIGDVGSNLVHRKKITPDGTGFVGTRIDEGREFLASTDIWFRPVQMANGPDGALHVLDMYREVIEHPKSLPPEIKQHLDLTSGRDRGRLYRVVPDREFEPRTASLSTLTNLQLVALLQHENAWHRETASRLLVERGTIAGRDLVVLKSLALAGTIPQSRVQALHVLWALGELEPATVVACLADPHPRVREQAVRLSEPFAERPSVREAFTFWGSQPDQDPRVRLQIAFSAGAFPIAVKSELLVPLLERDGDDPWIRFAAFSSLATSGGTVLAELLGRDEFAASEPGRDVLGELAELIGRQSDRNEVANVVSAIATANGNATAQEVTRRLALGLAASKSPLAKNLADGDLAKTLDTLVATARETARRNGATDERLAAIRTLSLGTADDIALLLGLLDVREPEAVQLAALGTLGARDEERICPALVERWSTFTPAVRREALETILSRDAWRTTFLDTVSRGTIPRAEIDTARLAILRTTADRATERRLDTILAGLAGGKRADVVEQYQPALELTGDAERGRAVFKKNCATCHRLENHGFEIGPNLATLKNRGPEAILVNVLDPNREVNPAFLNYVVVTTDGRQHVGILASQTATSVTLKRPEDKTETLLRADVELIRSSGLSMMPEGLEKEISVESMSDLLAYLRDVQ